jgi:GalNAc5-diNAcBac-PP-undecaprenol beta-1,3-glucosyltransferase
LTLAATVIIPTHDHGPTLLRSVPSALTQSVEGLEIFVVGDGVPDVTREVMAELTASDERVRFFDNPKGPRHGENHRHEALQEARGEFVCYLSDDDLWLPGHVEQLQGLLSDADFAHSRPAWIDTAGEPHAWLVDLQRPFYRALLLSGENRIPHPCAGHTLGLYRRLPAGWRTAPDGTPTDLYMWQQILSLPDCRPVSGTRPTVLHFPSPARKGWSIDGRLAELDSWAGRLADPGLESDLAQRVADTLAADAHALEETGSYFHERLVDADRESARLDARLQEVDRDRASLSRRLDELDGQLRAVDEERAQLSNRLAAMSSTLTWRLRARLSALSPLAARGRARPAAPEAAGLRHPAPTPAQNEPASGSPGPDRPNDTPTRHSGPSTR